ncbi:CPXV116 protein [Cowpox virus]|uniref:CPXV116 protein n=1 Tax=Cowpox virus TaxID=10243 RepID=A0A212Q3Q5_COWPX|nr:CPXV116 protein [Cowpox virus]SNB53999.1 CPXV116 protein [Cowpox virus]
MILFGWRLNIDIINAIISNVLSSPKKAVIARDFIRLSISIYRSCNYLCKDLYHPSVDDLT